MQKLRKKYKKAQWLDQNDIDVPKQLQPKFYLLFTVNVLSGLSLIAYYLINRKTANSYLKAIKICQGSTFFRSAFLLNIVSFVSFLYVVNEVIEYPYDKIQPKLEIVSEDGNKQKNFDFVQSFLRQSKPKSLL